MFFQLSGNQDELSRLTSGHSYQQQTMKRNKHLLAPSVSPCLVDGNNGETKARPGRRRKAPTVFDNTAECPADYLRKVMHRDVERQRRQEMVALYQSLRPLIPPEFLQGKRSISDLVDGTVRYIRYTQKRTHDLQNKRNRRQEWLNRSSSEAVSSSKVSEKTSNTIAVKSCRAGMEVNVSTALNGGLPLSRVLNVLVLEGLSIKSCISTRVHERVLHVIQIEVSEERNIRQNELQGKLRSLIFNLRSRFGNILAFS